MQEAAEQEEQGTDGAGASGSQKKPHAPRTKKPQSSDGASSLHLIYDQPGMEPASDSSGEDGEHA